MKKSTNRVHKYYNIISEFYKDKATSKGIPYINHIDEGVGYLENLHVSDVLINAFILHPFVLTNSGNLILKSVDVIKINPFYFYYITNF